MIHQALITTSFAVEIHVHTPEEAPGAGGARIGRTALHAILATAVEDELIGRNPCVVKGASTERTPERPVATIEQVYAMAEAIEPSMRALVLFATFTSLRLGKLRALRRNHVADKVAAIVERHGTSNGHRLDFVILANGQRCSPDRPFFPQVGQPSREDVRLAKKQPCPVNLKTA